MDSISSFLERKNSKKTTVFLEYEDYCHEIKIHGKIYQIIITKLGHVV